MFEKASRLAIRFATAKGEITVEDLWVLPLTSAAGRANLDDIARDLYNQLKETNAVSFVNPAVGADPIVQLKFDVVKHIIDVRVAENAAAAVAKANKDKKQALLGVLAQKENEALLAMPLDELRKQIEAL